jgi:hypothetical protein
MIARCRRYENLLHHYQLRTVSLHPKPCVKPTCLYKQSYVTPRRFTVAEINPEIEQAKGPDSFLIEIPMC